MNQKEHIDIDALLRDAYRTSSWAEEPDDVLPIHPSRKFLRHMKILQKDPLRFLAVRKRDQKRKYLRQVWGPRMQKAACLLLFAAVLTSLVISISTNETVATLLRIQQEKEPGFVKYEVDGNITDTSFTPWTATWIPDSYSLKTCYNEVPIDYIEIYENKTGDQIHITCRPTLEQGFWNDSDHGSIEQISVNGLVAHGYLSNDPLFPNGIYWFDEEQHVFISIYGNDSASTLLKIAESMKPIS